MHSDGSLDSDDITRGYMAPDIQMALRNQATLKWLNALHERPLVAALVAREYAAWAKLPIDDVTGALDYITDQASLDWMHAQYGEDIGHEEDGTL